MLWKIKDLYRKGCFNQTEDYIPNPDDMTSSDNYKEEEQPTRKKSKLIPILIIIILG